MYVDTFTQDLTARAPTQDRENRAMKSRMMLMYNQTWSDPRLNTPTI